MNEVIFLFVLAIVWMIFASMQDLKSREVANWLSFSLIIFAMGFRFFYSIFNMDNFIIPSFEFNTILNLFNPLTSIFFTKEILLFIHLLLSNFPFFYQGLIGLGIFFVLGNLFYYGRLFAGGDAKLMIALGAVLPFSETFANNLRIFILFFFVFLFVGAFYGIIWSFFLSFRNVKKFKKEFLKRLKKDRKLIYLVMSFGLILMLFGFIEKLFLFSGIIIFVLPYFYVYAKSIDESCMIKKIKSSELTEGDWLYQDVKVARGVIKKSWHGLTQKEINQIKKKHKIVLIRQGIPFIPVFLVSFLILLYIWFTDLFILF